MDYNEQRIKGIKRESLRDKNKRRYPPAKAQRLYDRPEDRAAEQKRIAQIVKDARKGKYYAAW